MKTKSNTINLLRPSVTLGDYSQHEASGVGGGGAPYPHHFFLNLVLHINE